MVAVLANGPGDWVSIPAPGIPKTQKILIEASLLNTQCTKSKCKLRIKGK